MKTRRRRLTSNDIAFIKNNYGLLTKSEIAKIIGCSPSAIKYVIKRDGFKEVGQREYTIYKGDEFVFTGNKQECMDYIGVCAGDFMRFKAPNYYEKSRDRTRIIDIGRWRID